MIGKARGSHTSPGIYTREVDLNYAVKSLGITTLGVVGETEKGPAFEPIRIENWSEFQTYFGGTNPAKFKESGYPKYELPYIAKSYLKESKQLEVCRVLGLSGYNAGPAWAITIGGYVVAVLRSRGHYEKYSAQTSGESTCVTGYTYDNLVYDMGSADTLTLSAAPINQVTVSCGSASGSIGSTGNTYPLTSTVDALGKFKLTIKGVDYVVSLNSFDKNYILDVLGTSNDDGNAPVFVEELYDVALLQMVANGTITSAHTFACSKIDATTLTPACAPVDGILEEKEPKRSMVGRTYLAVKDDTTIVLGQVVKKDASGNTVYVKDNDGKDTTTPAMENVTVKAGSVYKVVNNFDGSKYSYVYELQTTLSSTTQVFVRSEGLWYHMSGTTVVPMTVDINDYREQYRCASTPWLVSELKGDGSNFEVKRMLRFHTISDGNAANREVKISIENISVEDGLFDVVVRAFDDTDAFPVVLEKFTKCNMVPNSPNYVGLKLGTFDGEYMTKSKFVTVEIAKDDTIEFSVPCGFEGYPLREYANNLKPVDMGYNTVWNDDIKERKQYFGLSDRIGIDVDAFTYKGVKAYVTDVRSKGFHLDSRFEVFSGATFTVNGETGHTFACVSKDNLTVEEQIPVMGLDVEMVGSIYEDKKLRKFTVCPYGGFDGWDIYRGARTTSNDFKANKYKGVIENGLGRNFGEITYPEGLNLNGNAINSDYYAFLAGARQFANPTEYELNVFATPGIDYVNDNFLSQEILDMIEDERGDAIYVMTTPDKPFGASDAVADMFTPEEAVMNLEDSDVDSSYATTFYPWVKYFDAANNVYINLPATKDVVRNFAYTDNIKYPWFAPAGFERGSVECAKAHYVTKLDDEDTLYSGLINPVKTFAQDGVKLWGNMTMYSKDTPLNRVNVRRLMLRVKKLIEQACRVLIFEPNDNTVRQQFLSLVNPILSDIRANRGITDFKIEVDNSQEAIDRHELPATIWIKPTPTLEYIDLTFVITPEGASFE